MSKKNEELERLQNELNQSRQQIETAFEDLESKIRNSSVQIQELGMKAIDVVRSTESFMKENSIPVAAICLIGGYMIGSKINRSDATREVRRTRLRPVTPAPARVPEEPFGQSPGLSAGRPGTTDEPDLRKLKS